MSTFPRASLFTLCVAVGLACGGNDLLSPDPRANEARVLTYLSLSPGFALLYTGGSFSLDAVARDQSGHPMIPDAITYLSSDPAVATVSSSGIVTAVAAGTATISATATVGTSSRTGAILTGVRNHADPFTGSGVLLVFGARGWEPSVVHVDAGALIQWMGIGMSSVWGPPVLWLMDENYRTIEELGLDSGLAKRTFETPGTYRYCSGGCWDSADFGVIHVH